MIRRNAFSLRASTRLLSTICLTACHGDGKDTHLFDGGTLRLAGSSVVSPEAGHPMPTTIAVGTELLIVGGDDEVRVLDPATGRPVFVAGRRGSGPGEFQYVSRVQAYIDRENSEQFWVYDLKLGRLTAFALTGHSVTPLDSIITGLAGHEHVSWVDDTTLVGLAMFTPHRATVFNTDGTIRKRFGELPLVSDGAPVTVAHQILQPSLAIRPGGDLIAVGARWAGRIDIYSLSDEKHRLARVPVPFPPRIEYRSNGAMNVFTTDQETIFGYIGLTGTRDYIFALFSGRTRSSFPGRANYADQIHVFDWGGTLIDVLELDADALAIAASIDNSALYAIVPEPEPTIRKYDLGYYAGN